MALRLGALYDALKSAQLSDELAKAAAEEVAGYESRLSDLHRDMHLLKWMLGALIMLVLVNLAATFSVVHRLVASR